MDIFAHRRLAIEHHFPFIPNFLQILISCQREQKRIHEKTNTSRTSHSLEYFVPSDRIQEPHIIGKNNHHI